MQKKPLTEYLKDPKNSQESLAAAIGYRQSAISNMIKAGRNIFVITHENGKVELLEEKIIGSKTA